MALGGVLFLFATLDAQIVPAPFPIWQAYIIGFAGLGIITIMVKWKIPSRGPGKNKLKQATVAALREVKELQEEMARSLFVAFIKNDPDFTYEAHLVNPTDTLFTRVFSLTGATSSDIDSLFETGRSTREKGPLLPHSSLLLEKSSREELDWVIWHHLDLYEDGSSYPLRLVAYFPKGNWPYIVTLLPVLDREGMRLELKLRSGNKIIEEEIVGMDMIGGFWTSEELEEKNKTTRV